MTTYALQTRLCPACGNISEYRSLRSTNSCGSPDLDLRPPPMKRNTMHTWVIHCSECDCCFQPRSENKDLDFEIIDTDEYRRISQDQTLPKLAKNFMRLGKLSRDLDDQSAAWLRAAWVCDDEESKIQACTCRKKAYDILAENYEYGRQQHSADYIENPGRGLIALDLLRCSLHFEYALKKIDIVKRAVEGSVASEKEVMQAVVRFQAEKIVAQDARIYTIKDALAHVTKED